MHINRLTILCHDSSGGFDLVADKGFGEIVVVDNLTFDETLGLLARVLLPGNTQEYFGKPLFLPKPEPKHPDAAGDRQAPTTATRAETLEKPNIVVKFLQPSIYHWQLRAFNANDGQLLYIWNLYPSSQRISIDLAYAGPLLKIQDWDSATPETFKQAAYDACQKKGLL